MTSGGGTLRRLCGRRRRRRCDTLLGRGRYGLLRGKRRLRCFRNVRRRNWSCRFRCDRLLYRNCRLGGLRWRCDGLLHLRRRNDDGRRTCHRLRRNHARRVRGLLRGGRLASGRSGFVGCRCGGLCGNRFYGCGRLRRLCGFGTRRCRGMRDVLLQFGDGLQHIAGLGDLRQVDLRLVLFDRLRGRLPAVALPREKLLNALRFIGFDGTGMRLLLGNAHFRQRIENFLALDFQFPGQIVNSNLHPPLISSVVPSTR